MCVNVFCFIHSESKRTKLVSRYFKIILGADKFQDSVRLEKMMRCVVDDISIRSRPNLKLLLNLERDICISNNKPDRGKYFFYLDALQTNKTATYRTLLSCLARNYEGNRPFYKNISCF